MAILTNINYILLEVLNTTFLHNFWLTVTSWEKVSSVSNYNYNEFCRCIECRCKRLIVLFVHKFNPFTPVEEDVSACEFRNVHCCKQNTQVKNQNDKRFCWMSTICTGIVFMSTGLKGPCQWLTYCFKLFLVHWNCIYHCGKSCILVLNNEHILKDQCDCKHQGPVVQN